MRDLKLRAYAPVDNKLALIWEQVVDGELRKKDDVWFIRALKADVPFDEIGFVQSGLRESFTESTGKEGIIQGDLLCIGTKQCYIIF